MKNTMKLTKKDLKNILIMAECQKEIFDVVERPSCSGDDIVAASRYWEICEIISNYNMKVGEENG